MKQYISWNDYVTKYPRPAGYDCDKYSKVIAEQFVQRYCNCECTYTSTSVEDNSCDFNMFNKESGKKYICEIKDRWTYKSTDYNDHVFEKGKLKDLIKRIKQGEAETISLFTIYDDGCMKITPDVLKSIMASKQTQAPTTTALLNHETKNKNFILIKPDQTFYFCIFEDTENPDKCNFYVHYDFKPIDIQKLNEGYEKSKQLVKLF